MGTCRICFVVFLFFSELAGFCDAGYWIHNNLINSAILKYQPFLTIRRIECGTLMKDFDGDMW